LGTIGLEIASDGRADFNRHKSIWIGLNLVIALLMVRR
jgi:hypothetical protein